MRKILITGGTGFIGAHLVKELIGDKQNEIVLVDNLKRGRRDQTVDLLLAADNVRFVPGDITQPKTYEQLGTGYDEVYHLAAIIGVRWVLEQPEEVLRVNTLGTILLLDWLVQGGGRKILFSSTSEVYAWTQQVQPLPIPTPENVPLALTDLANPRSTYAASKILGESAVTHYCQRRGVDFTIVRYHNVYGPRMGYDHVIPELYQRARSGQNPLVVYSADHRRAFCYVSDAVSATIQAMRNPAANGLTLNIGNDHEEVAIRELAQRILKTASIKADITPQPAQHDVVARRCPDLTSIRQVLAYEPKVSLEDGLRQTIGWYQAESSPG